MSTFIEARVIQKIDTEQNWNTNELILYKGEIALVGDPDRVYNIKVGNGFKKFRDLPYMVDYVNGLYTGIITPQSQVPSGVNNVFLVSEQGAYTNFGNVVLPKDNLGIIYKNGNNYTIQLIPIVSEEKLQKYIDEKLVNSNIGFGGEITSLAQSPNVQGMYIPRVSGVYPNFGNLEYDPVEGFTLFLYKDSQFSKVVVPLNTVKGDIEFNNNVLGVSGSAVEKYAVKKINTIENLRSTSGEYENQIVTLLGYYEKGDKEPLNYKYTTEQGVDDGGAVINTINGSWIANFGGEINIRHFGAKCVNTYDDAVHVQSVVDFAVSNKKNIVVDAVSVLNSSIYIDRQVDSLDFENYFTIRGVNNGGFLTFATIPLFSTRIVFSGNPVSQLVKFEDLNLTAGTDYLEAYVLDGAKFLRIQFSRCSFSGLRLCYAATFTQSIYIFDCNIRMFRGNWFESLERTYDFKFVGCLMEAGETGLKINEPYGCSVSNSTLEGLHGTAILFNGSEGISINGNYFEANAGGDINMLGAKTNNGVSITGNMFYALGSTYSVLWGSSKGANSSGNSSLNKLHFFSNIEDSRNVFINDTASDSLSNYQIGNVLNSEGSFSLVDGSAAGLSITNLYAFFVKTGRLITFQVGLVFPINSSSEVVSLTGLPISASSTLGISVSGYSSYNSFNNEIYIDGTGKSFNLRKSDMSSFMYSDLSGLAVKLTGSYFVD